MEPQQMAICTQLFREGFHPYVLGYQIAKPTKSPISPSFALLNGFILFFRNNKKFSWFWNVGWTAYENKTKQKTWCWCPKNICLDFGFLWISLPINQKWNNNWKRVKKKKRKRKRSHLWKVSKMKGVREASIFFIEANIPFSPARQFISSCWKEKQISICLYSRAKSHSLF